MNFSEKISKGLKRPEKKFVADMLYGTLASGSCMLSEISRNLHENIKLIKTVNRLSRNLAKFEEPDADLLRENYLKYFMRNDEKFIIRAKKNRNVIYKGKTENIMDVAKRFKGKYSLRFKNKSGKCVDVKISIIPIQLPNTRMWSCSW